MVSASGICDCRLGPVAGNSIDSEHVEDICRLDLTVGLDEDTFSMTLSESHADLTLFHSIIRTEKSMFGSPYPT